MPVRSLDSTVLVWPDANTAIEALRKWALKHAAAYSNLLGVGYFGSCARGDWDVGSDLDVILIVGKCGDPFERRAVHWDLSRLPVPADLVVYTYDEWMRHSDNSLIARIQREVEWVYMRDPLIPTKAET